MSFQHQRCILASSLSVVVSGCVSLDPGADVRMASDIVEARVERETGWSHPWDDRGGLWDGRADLSSDMAVRVALRNNHELRGRVEAIVAASADAVQAHLLPNPIISVAVGFPTDGLGGDPLGAAVIQQLAWLWRRPAAIDSAEAALREQILTTSDAALRLVADVRQTHAGVVYAERSVALERETADLAARALALVEGRFAVGEASRSEVNRRKTDLMRVRTRQADRVAALAQRQRTLLALLARADGDVTWRTDDEVPLATFDVDRLDEAAVIDLAKTQRLDVAAAAAARGGRAAQLELADRGRLPDLSAGAEFRKNFSSRPGVFPTVSVTPKLFDDNSARVARAASELVQAEIAADRALQAAVAETRRAWIAFSAERAIVTGYARETVLLADEDLRLLRETFDAGQADRVDLLDTERRRNDARLDLLERESVLTDRLIELERTTGGSLERQPPLDTVIASANAKSDERDEVAP